MQQEEILDMFKSTASRLEKSHHRHDDIVRLLAHSIAHAQPHLSSADFDALVYIGGVLYKKGATHSRARAEIAETMQELRDARSTPPPS